MTSEWGGRSAFNGLIWITCERPTHLVISQSDQDDVWRVDPNLEGNQTEQRLPRVIQQHTALCDPHTHTQGQLSARCQINGGWLTIENTPIQHYVRGFPVYAKVREDGQDVPTFFRSFPLMWQSRLVPSKHMASRRPFPSILITWAYSGRNTRAGRGLLVQRSSTQNQTSGRLH